MRTSRRPIWTKTYTTVDEIPLVCTAQEAAVVLKMSEQWVKHNLQSGNLKGFKAGTSWRINKEDLLHFMGMGA